MLGLDSAEIRDDKGIFIILTLLDWFALFPNNWHAFMLKFVINLQAKDIKHTVAVNPYTVERLVVLVVTLQLWE